MSQRIIHPQRLAWDCARVFVALADSERDYFWLGPRLAQLLGVEFAAAISETRTRLLWRVRSDINIEAGLWRARLQDLLATRPDLSPALESLMREARARADEAYALTA